MSIQRHQTNPRMSQIVIHGDTIYLAGQVDQTGAADVPGQTQNILNRIDELLAEAGSSKKHVLSAFIHITDMANFDAMNSVWDTWLPNDHSPARTCVQSTLARPNILVEVTIVAAKAN